MSLLAHICAVLFGANVGNRSASSHKESRDNRVRLTKPHNSAQPQGAIVGHQRDTALEADFALAIRLPQHNFPTTAEKSAKRRKKIHAPALAP